MWLLGNLDHMTQQESKQCHEGLKGAQCLFKPLMIPHSKCLNQIYKAYKRCVAERSSPLAGEG
jgi:hypothetical protein